MKMKLQTMDPQMRAILGWERKTEEVYETTAETLGDFFKDVTDKDGRTGHGKILP